MPHVRKDIIISFTTLIDKEFQKDWIDPNYQHSSWDSLDYYVFDYLLNEPSDVTGELEKALGFTMYNMEEAKTIAEYLDSYMKDFEGEMPDSYYINHPEEPKILEGARKIT